MDDELEKKIDALYLGEKVTACLVCQSVNPNWLVELQDIVEEEGLMLNIFCDTATDSCGKPFWVKKGRLRLKDPGQCIDGDDIKSVFEKLKFKRRWGGE